MTKLPILVDAWNHIAFGVIFSLFHCVISVTIHLHFAYIITVSTVTIIMHAL